MLSVTYSDHIEHIRDKEYPQLLDTTYLDHAGTTLYAQSLIESFSRDLQSNLFGNPHSASPASDLSTRRINHVRDAVLQYFNADPGEFDVVFTANATAAIKLVMDSLKECGFYYTFHKDAHTSLVGIREVASEGSRCFSSDQEVEDWIEDGDDDRQGQYVPADKLRLFAYPAQSNMTGHRPPLSWCHRLRTSPHSSHRRTYTLLDAASFLTTGRLDLSNASAAPDFISLSFYKIFGFPDLGALIVRKDAGEVLKLRIYFGGGTVDMAISVKDSWHAMKTQHLYEILEDGTLPFHNIVALKHALEIHRRLFGSAAQISDHVSRISAWLYQELVALKHYNGTRVVQVYKETDSIYGDKTTQGPIIPFNIRRSDFTWVGKSRFESLAIACGLQLRTGGVCNPGGVSTMLQLEPWEMRRNYSEGTRCGNEIDVLGGKPTGIIRISLGAMTTRTDAEVFLAFVKHFFIEEGALPTPPTGLEDELGTIRPIEGGPEFVLPVSERTEKQTYESYSTWHKAWCVVDQETGVPLVRNSDTFAHLKVDLLPTVGLLTLERLTATTMSKEQLHIDLWNSPPQHLRPIRIESGRTLDPYTQPEIADFLSRVLGLPCTLARYRSENLAQSDLPQECVVSSCQARCLNKEDLRRHYREHARELTNFKQQQAANTRRVATSSSLSYETSIATPATPRKKIWRRTANIHGFSRKLLSRKEHNVNVYVVTRENRALAE